MRSGEVVWGASAKMILPEAPDCLLWCNNTAQNVAEGDLIHLDKTAYFTFSSNEIANGQAYIQLSGKLWEEDDSSDDDYFGERRSYRIFIDKLLRNEYNPRTMGPRNTIRGYEDYFIMEFTEDGRDQVMYFLFKIREVKPN